MVASAWATSIGSIAWHSRSWFRKIDFKEEFGWVASTCVSVHRKCLKQLWKHGAKGKIYSKRRSQGWTSCKLTWTFPFQQPGTCSSSILKVEPSKTRPFPTKTRVIWVPGNQCRMVDNHRCSSLDFGILLWIDHIINISEPGEAAFLANFSSCVCLYLPSLKLTFSHLKTGHPKKKLGFQPSICRCELLVSGTVSGHFF